jgi:hypothetical protein
MCHLSMMLSFDTEDLANLLSSRLGLLVMNDCTGKDFKFVLHMCSAHLAFGRQIPSGVG